MGVTIDLRQLVESFRGPAHGDGTIGLSRAERLELMDKAMAPRDVDTSPEVHALQQVDALQYVAKVFSQDVARRKLATVPDPQATHVLPRHELYEIAGVEKQAELLRRALPAISADPAAEITQRNATNHAAQAFFEPERLRCKAEQRMSQAAVTGTETLWLNNMDLGEVVSLLARADVLRIERLSERAEIRAKGIFPTWQIVAHMLEAAPVCGGDAPFHLDTAPSGDEQRRILPDDPGNRG
jgi:hypothetical protein